MHESRLKALLQNQLVTARGRAANGINRRFLNKTPQLERVLRMVNAEQIAHLRFPMHSPLPAASCPCRPGCELDVFFR